MRVGSYRIGLILVFATFSLRPVELWAFPENIRHGYQNCTTCHVSPNGGGLTTEYGRELSKEVMSTWGWDKEQGVAMGYVTPPSWLNVGGDFRRVFFFEDTTTYQSGKFIFMQADLEAAVAQGKWTGVATVGYQEPAKSNLNPSFGDHVILRRHYLIYTVNPKVAVRAGKFDRTFGVKNAEHTVATKRGLGFDQNSETYNLEGSYLSEKWNFYATGILGRPDVTTLNREKGVALSGGYAVGDTQKLGMSYYHGSTQGGSRNVMGPWAVIGLTEALFFHAEVDFVRVSPVGATLPYWGLVNYEKLGYEVYKGVIPFLTLENQWSDLRYKRTSGEAYSVGIQFLPRPHIEITAQYQLQKVYQGPSAGSFGEYGILMFHYYL